ncbi:MAG: extracellular solute-binding protein [Lachnospiraceae bacterium]|nr:extracellular solute-binding protein [Lachnospiraceae bacterium]
MKLKKLTALLLAGAMTLSLAACGGAEEPQASVGANAGNDKNVTEDGELSGKLIIWTLAEDLGKFADKFKAENPGVETEVVVIAPADYPTKVESALLGGSDEPDIIVGEPQMLESMYEAGFFEDLNQAPYNVQDYAGDIVDYVWEVGQDADGIQRAISYQITPAGIYYRRDIAKEVFGTDDPGKIGEIFSSYDSMLEAGITLKENGYRIFASDAETNYFSGDSAWVIDGKLNVAEARYEYMDMCTELYQQDLTAYASQWAAPWYQAMGGEVPILTAETQWGTDDMNIWDAENFNAATEGMETTEVFAYGLPSWGTITMAPHWGETEGNWGVCAGPAYGFGGGTYIGISSQSDVKDIAWEFLKYCTLNEETADWWIEESNGDVVSLVSALEKHANDEVAAFGGQNVYKFWLEQAEGIDYSKVTKYDTAIGNAWGEAITAVKTGQMTRDDAISEFYDKVASTYPDIVIER